MPKESIKLELDDEEETEELKINQSYATSYNQWRRKEELQKYKDRHGTTDIHKLLESEEESDSEEEDEFGQELTEEAERNFLKALSAIKSHDPRIYSKECMLFEDPSDGAGTSKKKEDKRPLTLKDYERKIVLEKGGKLEDEDDEMEETMADHFAEHPESYAAEQRKIKESFKKALNSQDSDDDGDGESILLKKRVKTKEEVKEEEADYLEWLKGHKDQLEDQNDAKDLKKLKEAWSKPDLEEDEKFLRDYILNHTYRGQGSIDNIPTYEEIVRDEILEEDETELDKQEEFERKYNFRYEEPDSEFVKSYPRTIKESVRRQETKRKDKRQELKSRKEKEKQKKREELREMQKLLEQEESVRLEKLRKEAGNKDLNISNLDADFDPDEHDRLMKEAFGNSYYDDGRNEEEKPVFSDSEGDEDMADWDEWNPGATNAKPSDIGFQKQHEPTDFVNEEEIEEPQTSTGRRRKRRSKFAQALSRKKPKYDKSMDFEEYINKYYGLNYEDFIGDKPCRFKYRGVTANSFGLTVEEVLAAQDKELNAWASIKKSTQYRSDQEEKHDLAMYLKKAENLEKKKKVLPSLFAPPEEAKPAEIEPPEKKEISQKPDRKKQKSGKKT